MIVLLGRWRSSVCVGMTPSLDQPAFPFAWREGAYRAPPLAQGVSQSDYEFSAGRRCVPGRVAGCRAGRDGLCENVHGDVAEVGSDCDRYLDRVVRHLQVDE